MKLHKNVGSKRRLAVVEWLLWSVVAVQAVWLIWILMGRRAPAVLDPRGWVAQQQYDLLVFASLLSLVVIVPVFVITFAIVWRYRETNKKAASRHSPDWDHDNRLEAVWWGIPILLIMLLAVVTWTSSHNLDPFKPLAKKSQTMKVQVVALDWKWLFLYPEQGVASVNYLALPEDTPVEFEITADAPMNSFWIPNLGGQVYAMAGMTTKLHLIGDTPGVYSGSSANLSGEGFSGMKFTTIVQPQDDFEAWVRTARAQQDILTTRAYTKLAKPTKNVVPMQYASYDHGLYDTVLMKYMGGHSANKDENHGDDGHEQ